MPSEQLSQAGQLLETMSSGYREEMRQKIIDKPEGWLGEQHGLKQDIEVNSDNLPPFVKSLFGRLLPEDPETVVSLSVLAALMATKDPVVMLERPLAKRVQEEVTEIVTQAAGKQGIEPKQWLEATDFEHGPEGISLFNLSREVLQAYVTDLEKNGWETETKKKKEFETSWNVVEKKTLDVMEQIVVQAKNIEGANKKAEVAETRMKLMEAAIGDLSLMERMAVMLNVSGKVEQKIAVTNEGQPCELFNLMFPEVSGMGSIAKVSRSNDGSLMFELSAMFPDKKGSSIGRYNLFQLPITVDDNGTLRSVQDVGKIWKELPKQVKNWLEDNLLKEAEFTARLRDPQKTIFRGLSNYFGKRKAFLKDGSLKFAWNKESNLLAILAERDNRSGGPGR